MADAFGVIAAAAVGQPGLELLLLHGSRARGDAHAASDWDFAYIAHAGFDPDRLLSELSTLLKADRIDLADLDRASGLLRYRAAADGVVVFERTSGVFERFWLDAITAWCEMAPILTSAYDALLSEIAR